MKIIIDEREPLIFEKLITIIQQNPSKNIQITKQVLHLGDIILTNDADETITIIERKTLQDLLSSIKDGRYEEQSYRLMNTENSNKTIVFYLLEGMMSSLRTEQEKKLIYSVIASLHFFKGFQTLRTSSSNETAEMIFAMADKIERNIQKGIPLLRTIENTSDPGEPVHYCNVVKKVKKDNITPDNIGEIMLSQIPGISSVTAIAIMQKFQNISHLIHEIKIDPTCLENIQYETNGKIRRINKSSVQNILLYFS